MKFVEFFEMHKEKCTCICGSTSSVTLPILDRYEIDIAPTLCLNCGHVYSKNQLPERELFTFYSKFYRSVYGASEVVELDRILPRIKNSRQNILEPLKEFCTTFDGKKVVEWGASGGWNLLPFKEAGCDVLGYDPDEKNSELAMKNFGISVRRLHMTTVSDFDDRKPEADILILNHVLEHVKHPTPFMLGLSRLLRPGGLLYLGLPTIESGWIWGFKAFFHFAHIHYFNSAWIVNVIEQLGYKCIYKNKRMGYFIFEKTIQLDSITHVHYTNARFRGFSALLHFTTIYGLLLPAARFIWRTINMKKLAKSTSTRV